MGQMILNKTTKVPFCPIIKVLKPRTHLVWGFSLVESCMTDKLMCIDKRCCPRHIF